MNDEMLVAKVKRNHAELYGKPPIQTSLAPGRVNLLGEHTDYNDGFVLPAAIDFYTCVSTSLANDNRVSVTALDFENETDHFNSHDDLLPANKYSWKNYVRGVFYILKKEGYVVHGCDLTISGTIPKGAGLSSSASLEVAILNSLNDLFNLNLDKTKIAELGQKVEIEFVGLSCGIMDQLSSARGQKDHAIMIDCRDNTVTPTSIPTSLSLMIVNSNVERELTTVGYNDRRTECDKAVSLLGIKSLRDISLSTFLEKKSDLPPLIARRAEHVIQENERVLCMKNAFEQNDLNLISKLMDESHQSMKNLFEITTPEIDFLVELIGNALKTRGGVRMTGGGFGGCVVVLLETELIDATTNAIEKYYTATTGKTASIYLCKPAHGVASVN